MHRLPFYTACLPFCRRGAGTGFQCRAAGGISGWQYYEDLGHRQGLGASFTKELFLKGAINRRAAEVGMNHARYQNTDVTASGFWAALVWATVSNTKKRNSLA